MDWDNLRFFLELARCGTLAGAARRLGVDHTTIARRVQALERDLATPLFARESTGHRLTEAGRRLLPSAEAIEAACGAVERQTPDERSELTGTVRVGATEGFGAAVVAPALAMLAQAHPALSIDLLALPRLVNLSRREADIVISLARPARGPAIVTKLADYALQLYASKSYLRAHAPIRRPEDLRGHSFVSYVDDLLFSKELQLLSEIHQPERFTLRSTSVLAQYRAVSVGAGIAVLPMFLVSHDPSLEPVLPQHARFQRTFWMSMPTELRHEARMKAVWTLLRQTVDTERHRLLPDATRDSSEPML